MQMPVHIVAAGGFVVNGQGEVLDETSESRWVAKQDVLGLVDAPALRTRYQAYLDFNGEVQYMDYVTHPQFELKLKRGV